MVEYVGMTETGKWTILSVNVSKHCSMICNIVDLELNVAFELGPHSLLGLFFPIFRLSMIIILHYQLILIGSFREDNNLGKVLSFLYQNISPQQFQ